MEYQGKCKAMLNNIWPLSHNEMTLIDFSMKYIEFILHVALEDPDDVSWDNGEHLVEALVMERPYKILMFHIEIGTLPLNGIMEIM